MSNQLVHASSPYLLQHAHNPVHWQEWGEQAFEQARREDKLVLVSIGYASCHWCHVMAHESFEDEQTAAIMNDHFICIKVDREERPDIDQYCMDAVQLVTGSGGWPLNCFLLPDGRPLHGGTYFRTRDWQELLLNLSLFYKNEKEQSLIYANNLTAGVKEINALPFVKDTSKEFPSIQPYLDAWAEQFDPIYGGFHWAPKFPMPVNLKLFLEYGTSHHDPLFTKHVHLTLDRMAAGGIHDQSGGGFARYSTDAYWKVPHFEKMLYDNAQLMSLYASAFLNHKLDQYVAVMEGIHGFVQRELTTHDGLFVSSLDADSEGVEGLFYCWKEDELIDLLGNDCTTFSTYYGITSEGNWEHGLNVLHRSRDEEDIAQALSMDLNAMQSIIQKCHAKLMLKRAARIRPATDDKVICSWNSLMITGYADAYLATANNTYLEMALRSNAAADENLFHGERLHRILREGKLSVPAFADDYACFIQAKLKLYEATGDETHAHAAYGLMQQAITLFFDHETGFFKYNATADDQINAVKTELRDDVIPSSNGVFGHHLLTLGFLFDRPDFHELLDHMLTQVEVLLIKHPTSYPSMLMLMQWRRQGFHQVITNDVLVPIKTYLPGVIYCQMHQHSTIPLLQEKLFSKTQWFVCKNQVCHMPVSSFDEALALVTKA